MGAGTMSIMVRLPRFEHLAILSPACGVLFDIRQFFTRFSAPIPFPHQVDKGSAHYLSIGGHKFFSS